jgi:hypothetical protein
MNSNSISEKKEKAKIYRRRWREKNKEWDRVYMNTRNKLAKEVDPLYHKRRNLKSLYGITLENYSEMYKLQEGKCSICLEFYSETSDFRTKVLHVDHCHNTGRVRGLLCHKCNKALGLFKDNVDTLKRAIEFVEVVPDALHDEREA